MDRNVFTVLFQPPFWVGIAERWEAAGYSAARVVFGAEPTDAQLYQWLLREWHRLDFSPAAEGERPITERKNPKRALRSAPGPRKPSAASGSRRGWPVKPAAAKSGRRRRSGSTSCANRKSAQKSGAGENLSRFGMGRTAILPQITPARTRA